MRPPEWLLRNVFPLREGIGVLIGQRGSEPGMSDQAINSEEVASCLAFLRNFRY